MSPKLPILAAGLVLAASMASATTPPKKQSSKSKTHTAGKLHKSSHRGKKSHKPRGQQAIDTQRAHEIQEALVREHYLTGEPSGTWDASTQAAMRKFQADQGWQTKVIPDSRALIRLGLGPSREHLLNPESAMVSGSGPVQAARAGAPSANAVVLPASTSSPGMQVSSGSDLSSSR
jgi:peptidoglycan hydrolase-like protein with peptidoglycan-binding domain